MYDKNPLCEPDYIGEFSAETVPNTGCHKYVLCASGYAVQENECENDRLFDPVNVTCSENYVCPETITPSEPSGLMPRGIDLRCPTGYDGRIPVPTTQCKTHIRCNRGIINLGTKTDCPEGKLWDFAHQNCRPIDSFTCIDGLTGDDLLTGYSDE
jgi:hypothetical protein